MIKLMDMVFTFMQMVQNMKEIGKMINKMERAKKLGKMEVNIMVIILILRKKVKESISGLI